MNTTHDGYEVTDMHCRWCPIEYYGWCGINHWKDFLWFEVESNWEHNDQRRYWSFMLLGFHFQGGWLWEWDDGKP